MTGSPLPKPMDYRVPDGTRSPTAILGRTDLARAAIQIVESGGEGGLHCHTGMDSFYYVAAGRVRFYGAGDVLVGEFGPGQGAMVPRNTPYRFEQVGDAPLELLQFAAYDRAVENRKIELGGGQIDERETRLESLRARLENSLAAGGHVTDGELDQALAKRAAELRE